MKAFCQKRECLLSAEGSSPETLDIAFRTVYISNTPIPYFDYLNIALFYNTSIVLITTADPDLKFARG